MFTPLLSRTLAVSGAALPTYGAEPILTPVRLSGTETLGELSEYTLELKTPDTLAFSPGVAANLDLDRLIGTEVTCQIELEGNGQFIPGMTGSAGVANVGAGVREITGIVSAARILREEGHALVYALTLSPWLWLADQNRDCRLFQDMTVVEITDAVLGAYTFPVEKRLIETYPKRDIQRQNWESDFSFICRLWQEWGIYFWFEHSDNRHRLVLCDSIGAHMPHGPAYQSIRYEAPGGRRIDEEHIHALEVSHVLTAGTVSSVDYDYAWPRADLMTKRQDPRDTAFANQEQYVWADCAQPQAGATGLSGEHNDPRQEADFLALIRVQALRCQGVRASGVGNLRGLVTGQTFRLTHYPQAEANREYLVVSSTIEIENVDQETQRAGGGADAAGTASSHAYRCVTHFVIQPLREVFRSLRTLAKPHVYGPETGSVVGPVGQEIWTDAYGRVKVQFQWDRQGRHDEQSGCWLRVSSPWQGNEFGATHVPRIGQEVIVDHLRGDPDLPIVTGRVVNAFQMPAWSLPDNQALSGFRSREMGGGRANHLVMDDTKGNIQAQLSSDHALSQLNLGSITRVAGNQGRRDARGEGFELRTDAHGAIRAAQGLLITTQGRPNSHSHVKDVDETVARLARARDLHEGLARLARRHEAQQNGADQSRVTTTIKAQNDAIRGGAPDAVKTENPTSNNAFPEFNAPHLTLASPAGIQLTTAGSTHIASEESLALTTGGDVGVATNKSLFASIADAFSLFVHKLGITLVAAAGGVRIEAQSDNVEIVAKKVLELISTSDWINLTAREGIRLNGGGTELEISPRGIRGFTDGEFLIHAASHKPAEPQAKPVKMPLTDITQAQVAEHFVLVEAASGWAIPKQRYRIALTDGQVIEGISSELGETAIAMTDSMQIASISLLRADGSVASMHRTVLTRDAAEHSDSSGRV